MQTLAKLPKHSPKIKISDDIKIGNLENNYFLDRKIILMIKIDLLKKIIMNGLILLMMRHIIMINI